MQEMTTQEALEFLGTGTRTAKVAWVASDGRPHVAPIWFIVEDGDMLFNTSAEAGKSRAMQRDPRISLVVDVEEPPYAFVKVDGTVEITEDADELLRVATPHRRPLHGRRQGRDVRRPQRCAWRMPGTTSALQHRRLSTASRTGTDARAIGSRVPAQAFRPVGAGLPQ